MTANKRDIPRRKISPFFVWTIIASAIFFAALAGSSRSEEGPAEAAIDAGRQPDSPPLFLGENPLYADMKKVNGKYVITGVGSKPLLFRLNDLEPNFDTHRYCCTRHGGKFALEVTHPEKCRDDEKTFRKVKADVWKSIAEDFLTIIANFFKGDVEECSEFDRKEYRAALQEAFLNSGLDRERITKAYDAFLASVKTMKAAAEKEYGKTLQEGLSVQFPVTVEDRSGFYKNDLTARDMVHIRANELPDLEGRDLAFSAVDTVSIERTLKDLKSKYAEALSQQSSFCFLDKSTSAQRYNIRIDAPDKIFLKDGMKQTVPLKVIVFSKTVTDVSLAYRNENKDLRIEDDGKAILLFNKTGYFIQIDSFSIHCENRVTSNRLNVGLAPGAFVSLDRADNRLHLPPRPSYFNATLDSVKDLSLSYGYNIRYSILGEKAARSLQKVETYTVTDLLG